MTSVLPCLGEWSSNLCSFDLHQDAFFSNHWDRRAKWRYILPGLWSLEGWRHHSVQKFHFRTLLYPDVHSMLFVVRKL